MKIKYIKEDYFKPIDKMKDGLDKKHSADDIRKAAKSYINDIAGERFNDEFTEYIVGVNSIFSKKTNGASCDKIEYYFDGDILVCKIFVSLADSGVNYNSMHADVWISFPENLREIETALKEEYNHEVDVKIILEPDESRNRSASSNCIFKNTSFNSGSLKKISLQLTDCEDLTDFCHLLNHCYGINWYDFILYIDGIDGKDIKTLSSKEPLNYKFEEVELIGFDVEQLEGISCILSEQPCDEYHNTHPFYRGLRVVNPTIPQFTGIITLKLDDGGDKPYGSYSYDDMKNLIFKYENWAKTYMLEYKNVFVILMLNNRKYTPSNKYDSYLIKDFIKIPIEIEENDPGNLSMIISEGSNMTYGLKLFNMKNFDPDAK